MDPQQSSRTSRAEFTRVPSDGVDVDHKDTSYPPLPIDGVVRRDRTFTLRHLCYQHRAVIRATPAAFAGTLWIAMMVYFFVYYTTVLEKVDGHFPRMQVVSDTARIGNESN